MYTCAKENLNQLLLFLSKISEEDYTKKRKVLARSSIGDHLRHVIEFYQLLIWNNKAASLNYDERKRSLLLAQNTKYAQQQIDFVLKQLEDLDLEKIICLETDYSKDGLQKNIMQTTVGRELAFCIEHSIHHQALIKTALIANNQTDLIDEDFGMAYATIRYKRQQCAQ